MTNRQFNALSRLGDGERFSLETNRRFGQFGLDGTVLRSLLYHNYVEFTVRDCKLIDVGNGRMREIPDVQVQLTSNGAVALNDERGRRERIKVDAMDDEYIEEL